MINVLIKQNGKSCVKNVNNMLQISVPKKASFTIVETDLSDTSSNPSYLALSLKLNCNTLIEKITNK